MTGGQVHFCNLDEWWNTVFTPDEQSYIRSKYGDSVDRGDDFLSPRSSLEFLGTLASWFTKDEERALAYRILDHAETLFDSEQSILEKHFFLQHCIEVNYRGRSDEDSRLPQAVRACERQIELAPEAARAFREEYPDDDRLPAHVGYKQLCIILHGDKTERAIALAREALEAGWGGDWERRIARMTKTITPPNTGRQATASPSPAPCRYPKKNRKRWPSTKHRSSFFRHDTARRSRKRK